MPDSVGARELSGKTGVVGEKARLRERASGRL